jgi:hypothetical protein
MSRSTVNGKTSYFKSAKAIENLTAALPFVKLLDTEVLRGAVSTTREREPEE